jgi:hypothetical protein
MYDCINYVLETSQISSLVESLKLLRERLEPLGLDTDNFEKIDSLVTISFFQGDLDGYMSSIDKEYALELLGKCQQVLDPNVDKLINFVLLNLIGKIRA